MPKLKLILCVCVCLSLTLTVFVTAEVNAAVDPLKLPKDKIDAVYQEDMRPVADAVNTQEATYADTPQELVTEIREMLVGKRPVDLRYDFNNDNKVDLRDLLLVKRYEKGLSIPQAAKKKIERVLKENAFLNTVKEMSVGLRPADLRYDLNENGEIDAGDLVLAKRYVFGESVPERVKDRIELILLGNVRIATPTAILSDGTVVNQVITEVNDNKITVGWRGAYGAFKDYAIDLVTGTITIEAEAGNDVGKQTVSPQDKEAYINALRGMLILINRQIAAEPDASNKEKLQSVVNFLSDVLLKKLGLEKVNIVKTKEVNLGAGKIGTLTVTIGVNNNEIFLEEKLKGDPAQVANGEVRQGWKLNLVTGEFTYTSSVFGDRVVSPQDKEAYLNGLENLLSYVAASLTNNSLDAVEVEKVQAIEKFLFNKVRDLSSEEHAKEIEEYGFGLGRANTWNK